MDVTISKKKSNLYTIINKIEKYRICIVLFWFLSSLIVSLLSTMTTVVFLIVTKKTFWRKSNMEFLLNAIELCPFGLLFTFLMPFGWISILGLIFAVILKDIRFLLMSIGWSIAFGSMWPDAVYEFINTNWAHF